VYVNTGQEFDGSDAGARPDEAVSWGKIKPDAENVKVGELSKTDSMWIIADCESGLRRSHRCLPAHCRCLFRQSKPSRKGGAAA
jgi:hypothetical protein